MRFYIFLFLFFTGFIGVLHSQNTFEGKVVNEQNENLFGATVYWNADPTTGVFTDTAGWFSIPRPDTIADIMISYVGYNPVKFNILPSEDSLLLEITGVVVLEDVEVVAANRDNFTSTLTTRNLESINSKELTKAACCSLGESFETNGSVDVNYTDALTGAREIQMLGLRGIYTQLLMEKRPLYYGLGQPFALDYLPGTWLNSIQISKGVSSIQSGMGGIAGQINLEAQKPWDDDPIFVNLYGSAAGRFEANVHLNKKFNETNGLGVYLHGDIRDIEMDQDNNGFMDMPLKKQLNGMIRYMNMGEVIRGQVNIQGISERRRAGQVSEAATSGDQLYTIEQNTDRLELFGKLAYMGLDKPGQSLAMIYNATYHDMQSIYGNTPYNGTQQSLYANLLFNTQLGSPDHTLNLSANLQADDFEEFLDETDFSREDRVAGGGFEYAWNHKNVSGGYWWTSFGLIAGARMDHHNRFGWLFSPQLSAKLNFTDQTVFRLTGGKGFRTPNVIAENIRFLPSSRQLAILETPQVEEAWNYGANFTTIFKIAGKDISWSVDLYRTEFVNQVVFDMEASADEILVYNLNGDSYSNSFLTTIGFEILEGWNLKMAYKWNDVKVTFGEELLQKPLIAKHRGLVTMDYETPSEKWMFNVSTQIIGSQRLPDNSVIPDNLGSFPQNSPAYVLLNSQITFRQNDKLEWYLGGENLTGYVQENPIVGAEDPFGDYFDATRVFAPLFGTRAYLGIRLRL
jgi:outer membrane receptor for ferrienterochelin and colicins